MPPHSPNKVVRLPSTASQATNNRVKPSLPAVEKPNIEALFDAEESALLRYAYGLVARREVAEEIVQDAFLKLHKHWSSIETPRAWLYRATRNLALNHLRKHQRETLTDASDEQETPNQSADKELGQMEAIGTLRTLIEELPSTDRDLIRLKYHDELSYGNIGEKLNLGTGNVGYKLHHILKKLSQALQKSGITSSKG